MYIMSLNLNLNLNLKPEAEPPPAARLPGGYDPHTEGAQGHNSSVFMFGRP